MLSIGLLLLALSVSCNAFLHQAIISKEGIKMRERLYATMSSTDPGIMSETQRKDLWKKISALEKEAVSLLRDTNSPSKEGAYKLFAESVYLKNSDPFIKISKEYCRAVDENNEAEAAQLLDQLAAIGAPPHISAIVKAMERPTDQQVIDTSGTLSVLLEEVDSGSTFSDTVTDQVRVKVFSTYDKEKSIPEKGQFMFSYTVGIYNEGVESVQIVARMWEIEKCQGEKEIVRGAGIMNTQPVINPGDVFTYTSICPLKVFPPKGKRVLGSMSGAYTMCKGPMGQNNFSVRVSKFNFILPESVAA